MLRALIKVSVADLQLEKKTVMACITQHKKNMGRRIKDEIWFDEIFFTLQPLLRDLRLLLDRKLRSFVC